MYKITDEGAAITTVSALLPRLEDPGKAMPKTQWVVLAAPSMDERAWNALLMAVNVRDCLLV